jgi:elongation factor Ts
MHNAVVPGLGKIGVLVGLDSAGDKAKLAALGKQVAMHVAATRPLALSADQLDKTAIDRERAIYAEQAAASGKPAEIVAKMVEGRLRKYYEEVVLLEQAYIHDDKVRVKQAVEQAGKDVGAPVKVVAFERFALGEGIDKEQADAA